MKTLFTIPLVLMSLMSFPSWAQSVYYCEWTTTVMISGKDILRTALDGKKFKMKVDGKKVTFTDNASLNDNYSIKDTWGSGETWEFIAGNDYKPDTIINYNERILYVAQINRLGRIVSSRTATCDKF